MLNFKNFIIRINEMANMLSPGELYKYDWRVKLFLDKYKDGVPFELKDGKTVVLKYDKKIADAILKNENPGKILLTSKDGKNQYKLSDFAKTKEFGGGKGSGAGSEITDLGESAQALYAAAAWNGSKTFTQADLTKAYKMCDISSTLEDIFDKLPPDWIDGVIACAQILKQEFGTKKYKFHRGSAWVKRLETHFKSLNSKAGDQKFSNINKWSPADIYLVSKEGESINIESTDSIIELNSLLTKALVSKDIIGVSLKKGNTNLKYYNFKKGEKKKFDFEGYTTGTKGFFGGKDVYLMFKKDGESGKIQFRTFPETWQGEIKGATANGGKLSYGPVQSILKKLYINSLSEDKSVRSLIKNKDSKFLKRFYSFYKKYASEKAKKFEDFVDIAYEQGESWMFSKYLGVELIDNIKIAAKELDFIGACISYAASQSELSAPFVKFDE